MRRRQTRPTGRENNQNLFRVIRDLSTRQTRTNKRKIQDLLENNVDLNLCNINTMDIKERSLVE
jgi:hypothetical protein